MVQVFFFLLILLFSLPADAAYKIYLKNGSTISGISSYEKRDGEVTIFFGGGFMGIPEKDIAKIEETGAPEKDFRTPTVPEGREEAPPALTAPETGTRSEKGEALQAQLDVVNSEIQAAEEEEARLVKTINERKGSRLTFNALQLRQLEADLAPLQQELGDIRVKKGGLLQQKSSIEGELRALQ